MPTTAPAGARTDPAATWKALAHLIAARPALRTWNPATNKFDRSTPLTSRLPRVPAAVLLYLRGRTQVLALDFDTKHHHQHTVDTDFTRALTWITECGGVAVTDQSSSGGRHILVPLAAGTSATAAEITPLLRLLEARLPSLDKTPMTNPKTGCITVPGSPCREGGYRSLDGELSTAIDAFASRSDPALLPRLNVLLGALQPAGGGTRSSGHPTPDAHHALTGTGSHTRLRPEYTRTAELPERITAYATTGQLPPDTTWRSHSEARQSVLAHAVLHGHSLATVEALIAPSRPWQPGLGGAYARYHHNAAAALHRDFHKALTWAATNSPLFRPVCAQVQVHTRGGGRGPELHRQWLANAIAWVEREYPGHPYRWIGAAIFQALAVHAVRAGEIINGVAVVGVGGRSLSIATGLLSETTVWQFLRDIRDRPGSPLVRTRVAQGRRPDYYALTRQNLVETTPAVIAATRVEDVHTAWKVIGHRHRRVYELIVHRGLTDPQDVFAAAHVGTSTGYATLAALATAGLITRRRGHVSPGTVTLDEIATAHHLHEVRAQRIQRHQRERATWHDWLSIREDAREQPRDNQTAVSTAVAEPIDPDRQDYLSAVLATGPPTVDEERHAIDLLAELVGARVLSGP
ncbi:MULTISPECIES: hypothetical protein [Mycobacterium]|uniref:Uncharacterized protein n=1 Tax=Mycobacterium paragordonae TaxID=1389713 RepID=A0AAJ1S915_9MYCO|nr:MULTISPECIES: hypothetical protein [Mycobacterium]MDP7739410.1 hypothetical protein [Mycobacterium paragordonae]RUP05532.1 MAG: hypothetical protein EKK34_08380 [Mycobacterium sp.]